MSDQWVSPEEFQRWQKFLGLRNKQVCDRLDIGAGACTDYRRRGAPLKIRNAMRGLAVEMGKISVSVAFPWEEA